MTKARQLADLISSGSIETAEITSLDAAKLTGNIADARIPNLATSKINSGTFADARISASSVTQHANNYTHPNHSGEVTSTADGATVITDNIVDEANLKVSNTPTNGYMLTAQSGNTGGLTWADAPSGSHVLLAQVESTTNDGTIGISDKFTATYDFYKFYCMWKQTADGSDTRFRWLTSGSTEVNGSKYIYMSDRHQVNTSDSRSHDFDHGGYNHNYALLTNNLPSDGEVHFHTLDWTIYNPYKGGPHNRAKVVGTRAYVRTDDVWRGGTMQIDYNDGSSDNYGGFKLFPSTGYMTDYKYQLYGVKGS